jgi:hypothetical protein
MKIVTAKTKAILQAYEDTFANGPGAVVLDDMRQAYSEYSEADDDDDLLTHIPPEARIWFRAGRRDVYIAIQRAMKLNRETVAGPEEIETTSDRSDT